MESQEPFKSTVLDLIKYDFLDPPSWRNQEERIPSVEKMIYEIIDFQESWDALKTQIKAQRLEEIERKFREKYCNINTDPLKDESQREKKQQESSNLGNLLEFYDNKIMEDELNCGLIEKSLVQDAHRRAVAGIKINKGCTEPGTFSSKQRFTTFKGEVYEYPKPDDMAKEVDLVLDRFNSLFTDAVSKTDKKQKLQGIFKSLAYFLFEILDLHPFGNGNGRLFRSFCYYVLSSHGHTMFPCPIYHACDERENDDHSTCRKPCKDNYEQVLVDARKSDTRHPQELATMLVESCWRTWREFMGEDFQICTNGALPELSLRSDG